MTDQILTRYKRTISELVLIPSGGGKFEVSADGVSIYSKLETGDFPAFEEIRNALDAHKR